MQSMTAESMAISGQIYSSSMNSNSNFIIRYNSARYKF